MNEEITTGPRRSGNLPKGEASKKNLKGLPMYYTFKDGNGFEIKVANTENPLICNRTQIIEIECIKKSNSIEPRFSVANAYDDELGMYFGQPLGIDKRTGDIKWQRFTIGDRKTYDCKRHADAIEWSVVSRSSFLEGSPYQRGKVFFRKFDKEKEARDVIEKATLRSRSRDIATTMIAIEDQMDMFRNFGRNPEGFTPLMLQAEIIKIADRNPKEFIDIWENKNRVAVTTFNRCIHTGLIAYDITQGGFMWKNTFALGVTEQTAIQALYENKSLYQTAELESKSKDALGKRIMSQAEEQFFGSDNLEEDVELIDLRIAAKMLKIDGFMSMQKDKLRTLVDSMSEN